MIYQSKDAEKNAAFHVAELMVAAAKTAPKGCGVDNIVAIMIDGEEKDTLAETMRKIAADTGQDFIHRDANNVDGSTVVVAVGVRNIPLELEHCGFCGFEDCAEMILAEANCAFNITDLGIAVGSAAAVAADNRIDNRIMYSIGKAIIALKYFPEDVRVVYGIPLSTSSKSIFFDRDPENVMV